MREASVLRVCYVFSSILLIGDPGLLPELPPKNWHTFQKGGAIREISLSISSEGGPFDAPNQSGTSHTNP